MNYIFGDLRTEDGHSKESYVCLIIMQPEIPFQDKFISWCVFIIIRNSFIFFRKVQGYSCLPSSAIWVVLLATLSMSKHLAINSPKINTQIIKQNQFGNALNIITATRSRKIWRHRLFHYFHCLLATDTKTFHAFRFDKMLIIIIPENGANSKTNSNYNSINVHRMWTRIWWCLLLVSHCSLPCLIKAHSNLQSTIKLLLFGSILSTCKNNK